MHLSDCFIDVMAYVGYQLKSVETRQPPYDQVKTEIWRLLSKGEAATASGAMATDDYENARFAVCAWIDEAILGSAWLQKNCWLNDQLQRFYYNTTDAGEEFFDRLNSLDLHQREVREVYYLCLAIGFTGRYCHSGDEHNLEQIKSTNLKLLFGSPLALHSLEGVVLFPEAHPGTEQKRGKMNNSTGSRVVSAVCLAAPVILFCILYLIYYFTLSGISDNFLRTVIN